MADLINRTEINGRDLKNAKMPLVNKIIRDTGWEKSRKWD